jgi:hypothetical protein
MACIDDKGTQGRRRQNSLVRESSSRNKNQWRFISTLALLMVSSFATTHAGPMPGTPGEGVVPLNPIFISETESDETRIRHLGDFGIPPGGITPGIVVLLETPGPNGARGDTNICNWSDVVVFNAGNADTGALPFMLLESEQEGVSNDDTFGNIVLGDNTVFLNESNTGENDYNVGNAMYQIFSDSPRGDLNRQDVMTCSCECIIPEPPGLTLFAVGAVGLVGCGWRYRRQAGGEVNGPIGKCLSASTH